MHCSDKLSDKRSTRHSGSNTDAVILKVCRRLYKRAPAMFQFSNFAFFSATADSIYHDFDFVCNRRKTAAVQISEKND